MTHKDVSHMIDPKAFPTHGYGGGMTLRDYFAAAALQSIFVRDRTGDGLPEEEEWIAKWSYAVADAFLAERAKETP